MELGMNNNIVTVFGGDGFVGRYVVQQLLKAGAQVRVASRNPKRGWFLKAQANLGQISYIAADVTRPETLSAAVSGADAVINLVGAFAQMDAVQVAGAENVAKAAQSAGVRALVHISAIGADAASPSNYGRTKGEGEAAVRCAFPSATILRPSIVFGREDQFVNRFARLIGRTPILPVIKGDAKFQPVFVGDVARAVLSALTGGAGTAGQTYSLGGPEVLSMRALNAWIGKATGCAPFMIDVPDVAAGLMARLTGWMPLAPMTYDQWLMLQSDNIVAPGEAGLADLGVEATPLEAVAPGWLDQYQRHGRFAQKAAR
jgi:uncharacterized protein YbjT (DUF2867 family)